MGQANDRYEAGEAIAKRRELAIPSVSTSCSKVKPLSVQQLISTLPLLLELEVSLKQGAEDMCF